ncbi:hypothetical protein [Streptosporangium sp. NPDC000396]|uniref:hypothetical protein n=1 Tax=Streptosporangium sp. NPDC000396 TaxID=3366185 RepID=UPI003699C138
MARKRSGDGPVVGEGIGYGGRAGRRTARGAAGRGQRPRRAPGRRAAEGRVRRRGAPPLEYAVELDELAANPLHKVRWKPPKTTETVDPRVAVDPRQARELLTMVTYVGGRGRGRRLMALFACMYYAALRPAEAIGLRLQDCHLPAKGWERLTSTSPDPRSTRSGPTAGTRTRNGASNTGAVPTCDRCRSRPNW